MTQIVVTLENGADTSLLRRMIENMKGVLKTSVKSEKREDNNQNTEQWISTLRNMRQVIDPSLIDMNDERTKYLMNK